MSAASPIRIDVFADTICPWCWIGKRRLARTLAERPDLAATVVWHAYRLDPDLPATGMDRREYMTTRFGTAARARELHARVRDEGAKEGLAFDFASIVRVPATLDSHRLVRWAASQPPGQEPMVESLFRAYFTEGADLGDRATLAEVAARAGFDGDAAGALLAGDDERAAVEEDDARARAAGIDGVPCFVVDAKVAVPGAVEPAAMLEIFERYDIGAARA